MARALAILTKLARLDRRYIYLVMAVATALPMLSPLEIGVRPSEETRRFDQEIDKIIASPKPLLVEVDFGPQTMAELEPLFFAVMHKLFKMKKKIVFINFSAEATGLLRRYLKELEETYALTYGQDYAYLGYAASYFAVIYALGTSVEEHFHADDRGTPLKEIPLLRDIHNSRDFSAVFSIASNTVPRFWITWGVAPFGFDFLMACPATNATDYYTFLQTKQLKAILAGGRAGAEYEGMLVDQGVLSSLGVSSRGLDSLTMALLTIIAFIVLGNLGYFAGRLAQKKGQR